MDLIFMALQMVWELILVYPWLSALIVAVAVLPWLCALLRGMSVRAILSRRNLQYAFAAALVCGVAAFFLLPWFFKSALGEMRYYVDWLFHAASVLSVVLYAWFVLLPVLACRRCGKRCG